MENDYKIKSPYAGVVWDKDKAYKGNLHTHSTYSDAEVTLADTVIEHYEQGFDFLAMTDHGTTGVAWNKRPDVAGLYVYQKLLGFSKVHLTDGQYEGITEGTYPLKSTGKSRGYKMTCVTGGNEFNALTATKSHVNGFFLPEDSCSSNYGYENGFRYGARLADKNGGFSHLNHLGDWLASNKNINAVYDTDSLRLFRDILLEYSSCLGIEVFNETNNATPYDRILWDNLLMETLPYGRTVIGFSNSDTHRRNTVDSSFSMFMMSENTVENIKATMQSGAFFCVTRKIHPNDIIGPSELFDVMDKQLSIPMFKSLTVDGHKVTAVTENGSLLKWIANGKVIFEREITADNEKIILNLDEVEGSEKFLYIRAELFGEGGLCASQALVIDRGAKPLTFKKDMSFSAKRKRASRILKSARAYVIAQEIHKSRKNKAKAKSKA